MPGITKLFLITYAVIKDILSVKISKAASTPIAVLLSTIVLSLIYIILIPFALFRLGVRLILEILHGESFGGFLSGLDAIFEMNPDKTVINVVNIYSSREDPPVTIEKLTNVLRQIYQSSFKFSSSVHQMLGYHYFVKDSVPFKDVFSVVRYNNEGSMSKEMLFDYLEKNCSTLHENQMWKVIIFEQPIKWSENREGYKQYAVIWILRHSLGDGPSVITIFQKYAVQEESEVTTTQNLERIRQNRKKKIGLDDVCVRRNPVTTKLDGLALKIPDNTNWYIASVIEERSKYVPMVKRIKDRLGVSFVDVISAAVTIAVHDYVKKREVTLDNFTIAKVIRLKLEDLLKLRQGTYKFEEVENNFGLIAQQLPLDLEGQNMKKLMQYLHEYNKSLQNTVDPIIAYTVLRHFSNYLPMALARISCKSFMDSMTIGVTNMVGFRKSTLCGNAIEDIFFFTPDVLNTAFTFCIFSYDERFQILLTSRKGFVYDREELQQILNNVFKYIDKIEQEIRIDSTL